jgi:GTP 3',8-cyclase
VELPVVSVSPPEALSSPTGDGPELPLAGSAVEFSPMKLLWHGDVVQRILAGEDTYPLMIELSLTMACDLRCVWCVDLPWREARPGTLKKDVLLRRLEEFRALGTDAITIEGGGEPTLHYAFDEIVTRASDMGFKLGLITHGGHLPKHVGVLDRFSWIRISLDAYSAEVYEALKGPPEGFVNAFAGMEAAVKVRDARTDGRRTPVVGVGYLSSMDGTKIEHLDPLLERLRETGVDYVQFRRIQSEEQISNEGGKDVGEVDLLGLKERHETSAFRVYVHQMEHVWTGNAGLPCLAHRLSVQVGGSGEMYVCCRLRTAKNGFMGKFGSLYDEASVAELWAGPARQSLVRVLADEKFTSTHCPECRLTKYNVAIAEMSKVAETSSFV